MRVGEEREHKCGARDKIEIEMELVLIWMNKHQMMK